MDIGDYTDFDGRSQVIMSEDLSGENPYRIAVVHVNGEEDEEGKANARLIASAPAMLEALEAAEELQRVALEGEGGEVPEDWGIRFRDAAAKANSLRMTALAQARGEEVV